jgi:predicted DsbA family dithiol-disulfide isomerase
MFIDVWSDYVCPFCYLQLPVIKQVAEVAGISVRWRAFELRPEPAPLLDPKGDYLRRVWQGSIYPMAERAGMTLRLPPVQPRSRKALEAAEYARDKGHLDEMHQALFKAFFEEGRNIDEIPVLLDIAGSVGLNPSDLLGSLQTKLYTQKVIADERMAQRFGIIAVPAMVLHSTILPLESGVFLNGSQTVIELENAIAQMKRPSTARPR